MVWKLGDATPLPKTKPVKQIKKDLRPISLTLSISKVAEDFIVTEQVRPAVLRSVWCDTEVFDYFFPVGDAPGVVSRD